MEEHRLNPVKHGHWQDTNWVEQDALKSDIWSAQCSSCKKFSSWVGPHYTNDAPYEYCPNCGARMGGKDDERID